VIQCLPAINVFEITLRLQLFSNIEAAQWDNNIESAPNGSGEKHI
jgi:hypothetical protein